MTWWYDKDDMPIIQVNSKLVKFNMCEDCGCTVLENLLETHEQFHENLVTMTN